MVPDITRVMRHSVRPSTSIWRGFLLRYISGSTNLVVGGSRHERTPSVVVEHRRRTSGFLEQHLDAHRGPVTVSGRGGRVQGRLTGSVAGFGVGPGLQQKTCGRGMATATGQHQRRRPGQVDGVDVSSERQ